MRSRGFVVGVVVLAALVVGVVMYGGRVQRWVLRMHGIDPDAAASASAETANAAPLPVSRDTTGAAAREGWPDTRPGELGHRWVKAFGEGEKQMKECLADIMSAESLAKKDAHARVERYRDIHEKYGTLTLVSVDKSESDKVEVTLAASDLSQHHFVFATEKAAPFKLLSVSMMEPGHMIPGFGH